MKYLFLILALIGCSDQNKDISISDIEYRHNDNFDRYIKDQALDMLKTYHENIRNIKESCDVLSKCLNQKVYMMPEHNEYGYCYIVKNKKRIFVNECIDLDNHL